MRQVCAMRHRFLVVFALASILTTVRFLTAQATPTVIGHLDGPRTAIFVTPKDSCDPSDIPDAMARAFRDYMGIVHFSSASTELFQGYGPTLDTVEHSCVRSFDSVNDPNPADFNDQVWIDSFHTLDGKHIAALAHTEYHGWAIAGECNVTGNNQYSQCEYDADTYHFSDDGGYHFFTPTPPANFVAGFPYQYTIDEGPYGYSVDSNIIEYNGWYYAISTDVPWPPNCATGTSTPCLVPYGGAPLRTQNVFDPASWRTWNGSDFSVSFADPYLSTVEHPEQHTYTPIPYLIYVGGLNVYEPGHLAVATLWDYWDYALGPPGMYLTSSTDMIHWSKPSLVVTLNHLLSEDEPGSWLYAYFSLIDPDAPDLNFATIGEHPYLYYVRLDNNNSGNRILFRRRLTLTVTP